MKVVAILRLNPEATEELELTDDGRDIDREWVGLVLNPFDDQALEQAVLLKEASGAETTAIAVDGEGADRMLRSALARGADKAVKIALDEDAPRHSRSLAPVYAEAVRAFDADLVLTGVLSTDDLFGELAPCLAAELGWSQASAVSDLRLGDGEVLVRQEYSGGHAAVIGLKLPAVIGLQTASHPPRYVAGSKLRDMLKVEIPGFSGDAVPDTAFLADTRLELPDRSGGATMLEGDAEAIAGRIASILAERGLS